MDRRLARLALISALAGCAGLASANALQDPPQDASKDAPQETPRDVPIPEKQPPPAGSDAVEPTVTIRSADNGDRIEEYREGGKVYMVRIVPLRGKPYYLYDDDRNGRLDRSDADRHTIAPVYWTLYEWD